MIERSQKYSIEELNEEGYGFRITLQHDMAQYVSFDMVYIADHEDTEQDIGVIMTPKAAFGLAEILQKTALMVRNYNEGSF